MKQTKLILLFLCFLYFPTSLFSRTEKDSTDYWKHILQIDTFSIDQKKIVLKKAIEYSRRTENMYAAIDYQIRYGELFFNAGKYRESVMCLTKAVAQTENSLKKITSSSDLALKKKWQNLHIEALAQLGRSEVYLGVFDEAMLRFNRIMDLYGSDVNSIGAAKAYNGMGIVFGSLNKWSTAIEYFKKSLAIYKKQNNIRGQYVAYSNIGGTYLGLENYAEALNSFVEMHRIVLLEQYSGNEIIYANLNLALAYQGLKQYELSKKYYLGALDLADSKKEYHLRMYIQSSYAVGLYDQGQYAKAQQVNDQLLREAQGANAISMQMSTLRLASAICEKQGNYKQANLLLHQSYSLLDSITNLQGEEKLMTLKYKFDNYKTLQERKLKAKSLELAEEKVSNRNLWIAFLLALAGLASIAIIVMTRRILYQCRVNNLMKERLAEAKEGEGQRLQGLKEHFGEQLDTKNKELTSNALLFLKFNELAISLMDKVKDLKIHFTLKSR
ncbi:MAG: tetratricopeptide repeat protein, partial [Bacteroidales bacterium]